MPPLILVHSGSGTQAKLCAAATMLPHRDSLALVAFKRCSATTNGTGSSVRRASAGWAGQYSQEGGRCAKTAAEKWSAEPSWALGLDGPCLTTQIIERVDTAYTSSTPQDGAWLI